MSDKRSSKKAIGIYCSDQSHVGKRVQVALFLPQGKKLWGEGWTKVPAGKGNAHGAGGEDPMQILIDLVSDQPVDEGFVYEGGRARVRYSLKCKLCDLGLTVRGENIYPLLDIAAQSGVSLIPLSVLVATLSR